MDREQELTRMEKISLYVIIAAIILCAILV